MSRLLASLKFLLQWPRKPELQKAGPIYKRWILNGCPRPEHAEMHGYMERVKTAFVVAGYPMMQPGDLDGGLPVDDTRGCLCQLEFYEREDDLSAPEEKGSYRQLPFGTPGFPQRTKVMHPTSSMTFTGSPSRAKVVLGNLELANVTIGNGSFIVRVDRKVVAEAGLLQDDDGQYEIGECSVSDDYRSAGIEEFIRRSVDVTNKLIGARIGYVDAPPPPPPELELKSITSTIEVPASGDTGKLFFLDSSGQRCSTEDAFKDYMEQRDWTVMRAEVSFWQAMFCLSFWEEIGTPSELSDIPSDLFQNDEFYIRRQRSIDAKRRSIAKQSLPQFIQGQLAHAEGHWIRLLNDGYYGSVEYIRGELVQDFLSRIDPELFAMIVYRIARNPNQNRAGVSDFVVWDEHQIKFVETKRVGEPVRDSQKSWIAWMCENNIPNEIVRLKAA